MRVKGIVAAILLLCFLSCGAEAALSVNGKQVSVEEANAFMFLVTDSYRGISDYYSSCLGIDYWSLTYSNGVSVWDCVKADAFEQLVMMNVLAEKAETNGLGLSESEVLACTRNAAVYTASGIGFSEENMSALLQKQLLADKEYSYLLSLAEIDEAGVLSLIDPAEYTAYTVQYLCIPYYLYSKAPDKRAEYIRELEVMSGFEGSFDGVARYNGTLLTGVMTLSPSGQAADDPLFQAASQLSVGDTGTVIETDYGLFVLRLTDISDSSVYLTAVEDALRDAREEAFQSEYERMYAEAEYELSPEYWSSLIPS